MGVWPGFGVNYKAAQANWAADAAYFRSIGITSVRLHMPGVPIPWSAGTISSGSYAFWRYAAQWWHQQGFWVTWGPTHNGFVTAGSWQSQHDAILAEATYLVQQNIVIDEFEIGNEFEISSSIQPTITSLTQSGGTATAVTSSGHNFSNNESVTIYSANPSGYNGTFTITKVNSTTFTFSVNSGTASPATGIANNNTVFAYCYSMTIPQLNVNLRQLATDIKAISGWSNLGTLVSYGDCGYKSINGGTANYDDWVANGLGGLDTISIHPYGSINTSNMTISNSSFNYIARMVTAFGNNCYISEFGIDASSTNQSAVTDAQAVAWLQTIWTTIKNSGVPRAMIYEWCEYLNNTPSDYGFSMRRPDGSMNPQWWVFFQSQPKLYPSSTTAARSSSLSRSAVPSRSTPPSRRLI